MSGIDFPTIYSWSWIGTFWKKWTLSSAIVIIYGRRAEHFQLEYCFQPKQTRNKMYLQLTWCFQPKQTTYNVYFKLKWCFKQILSVYGSRETKPHFRIQFCGVAYYVDMRVAYYATSRMMSLPSHIYANAIFMVPTKNLKYKFAGCRQNNAFNPDFENITFLHQVRISILSNLP